MSKTEAPMATAAPTDLNTLLGADRPRRWWQRALLWWSVAALAAVGVGIYVWQSGQSASTAPRYVTEELRRGNLTLTVSANGTLQPTRSVTIGSELSGTVRNVRVDVNDKVKKGQLLVELDTAKLDSQVLRSRASLASAQARLAQALATTKEAIANLGRLEEVARLSGGKVPSAAELDTGRATLDRARADETSARATVEDARAALSADETNLSKASIRSPIDGVVLTRTVEPGNAVAASLQAVTLFTVAEDLTRLRLDVNVDEADVGSVKVGQDASFTVSAYPSRRYPAKVTRVSFGSTKTDNVVTYITWLDVNNSDMSLRPGMTAAATVTSTERKDVLLVPNTALRFTPAQAAGAQAQQGAGGAKPAASGSGGGIMSQLMPRMPRSGSGPRKPGSGADAGDGAGKTRQVWVLQDGAAQLINVQVGISDGRHTEVTGEGLTPGMAVITDQRAAGAKP
ncbi:HlyD family secretion protein [Acidovorax sp. 69]|uniref:efflux RND transporter periplasmic adaptor subunit n=1 Tax=Acidovorax sp. 69 TaxID=2035202 RepID=UPI000C24141E|nr:efflux RND transporter periplasmic adaptor subunit [Acidovorax sp. 69]PJI98478.1 HlyD family secretion protein [Acidovorax sp. 69]